MRPVGFHIGAARKRGPYARRLAYLESDGTEYIDTGIVPSVNIGFSLDGCFMGYRGDDSQILGCRSGGKYYEVDLSQGAEWIFWQYVSGSNKLTPPKLGERRTFLNEFGRASVGGDVLDYSGYTATWSHTVFLFAMDNGGVAQRHSEARIYGVEFFGRDRAAIARLVPVLDLGGRPAMYDEVSGQFFYNQGSGEFTWGEL